MSRFCQCFGYCVRLNCVRRVALTRFWLAAMRGLLAVKASWVDDPALGQGRDSPSADWIDRPWAVWRLPMRRSVRWLRVDCPCGRAWCVGCLW
jgi:hypothetical protein